MKTGNGIGIGIGFGRAPELIVRARAEQRFTFDSLAECARARAALEAERLQLDNALTVLEHIEHGLQPTAGAS